MVCRCSLALGSLALGSLALGSLAPGSRARAFCSSPRPHSLAIRRLRGLCLRPSSPPSTTKNLRASAPCRRFPRFPPIRPIASPTVWPPPNSAIASSSTNGFRQRASPARAATTLLSPSPMQSRSRRASPPRVATRRRFSTLLVAVGTDGTASSTRCGHRRCHH